MSEEMTFRVPGLTCNHCIEAIHDELDAISGVDAVEVDLDAKLVTVRGDALTEAALRAAIDAAGYEPE